MVKTAEGYPVSRLKELWGRTFGDTDEYISLFFGRKFRPENTFIIDDNGLKAMAYFTEERIDDMRCAYICGVATDENSRGMGYSKMIMSVMPDILKARGYDMAFLIPATDSLFGFYAKMGFSVFSCLERKTVQRIDDVSDEEFSEVYDYEKLNRFYNGFFNVSKPERNEAGFGAIYDCYKNVRIYKSGYIIYEIEDNVLHVKEHTLSDVTPYVGRLMKDLGAEKAIVSDFDPSSGTPFSMAYYFKDITPVRPAYVNLMLN